MSDVSQDYKDWATHLRSKIPGEVAVRRYYDDGEQHHLDIFSSKNTSGIASASIGVMESNQSRDPNVPIYSEIVMDARGQNDFIANGT